MLQIICYSEKDEILLQMCEETETIFIGRERNRDNYNSEVCKDLAFPLGVNKNHKNIPNLFK